MTAIETAIREAVEKGEWKGRGAKFNYYEPMFDDAGWYLADGYAENEHVSAIFLDPAFWQALGKARGWGLVKDHCNHYQPYANKKCDYCKVRFDARHNRKVSTNWLYQWHRFIYHLVGGKTAESFFAAL